MYEWMFEITTVPTAFGDHEIRFSAQPTSFETAHRLGLDPDGTIFMTCPEFMFSDDIEQGDIIMVQSAISFENHHEHYPFPVRMVTKYKAAKN